MKTKLLPLTATMTVGFILTSCGHNPKKPTPDNFTVAIQAWLDKQPACIDIQAPSEQPDFRGRHHTDPHLEPLLSIGLLVKTDVMIVDPDPPLSVSGQPHPKVPGIRYDLTELGKRFVKTNERQASLSAFGVSFQSLCFGDKKVLEIVRFSEPSSALGQTMTQVTYKYRLTNVADWAKAQAIEAAYATSSELKAVDQPQEKNVGLVLMSDGWRVPNL